MKKASSTAAASIPSTDSAPTKPAVKKTPVKKTAARKPAARKTEAVQTTTAPSLAPTTPASLPTTVKANIDIGFGNLLYLRGDGPGLSWEQGLPMECVGDNVWTWTTRGAIQPFTYKVLVNDVSWSVGEDYLAHTGQLNVVEPQF